MRKSNGMKGSMVKPRVGAGRGAAAADMAPRTTTNKP